MNLTSILDGISLTISDAEQLLKYCWPFFFSVFLEEEMSIQAFAIFPVGWFTAIDW